MKNSLYDEFKSGWDMHYLANIVMFLLDFKSHVGRLIDGFDGVHGGHGAHQMTLEGKMLLKSCQDEKLCVEYML